MLDILEITNYQSLRRLKLRLKSFTVITGPTGAGKSAVIRALRLLAFNAKGTSYISYGQSECTVTAACGGGATENNGWAVGINRGSRGKDYYVLSAGSDAPQQFTKLAGKVPPAVSAVLQLSDLNFASQFDPPFLLTDSGAEVARRLGQLTNVTMLFSAAREANRRRQRVKDRLDDASAEVERLQKEMNGYATLPQRIQLIQQAEEASVRAAVISTRAIKLERLLGYVSQAQEAYRAFPPLPPALPDQRPLQLMILRCLKLQNVLQEMEMCSRAAGRLAGEAAGYATEAEKAEAALHQLLADAGVCPLCGLPTRRT